MTAEAQSISAARPRPHSESVTELGLLPGSYTSHLHFLTQGAPPWGAARVTLLSSVCKERQVTNLSRSWELEAGNFVILCETPGYLGMDSLMPRTQVSPFLSFSIQCSRNCSGGFQIREIQCVDSRDHRSLRPFHCRFLAGLPPPQTTSCNLEPCEEWQVEPWSQVLCLVHHLHNWENMNFCVTW